MQSSVSSVKKVNISKSKGLDPIGVYLEDIMVGCGRVTITCFNQAWTCGWPAMGENTVAEFFCSCDEHYLARSLSKIRSVVVDYDRISEDIGQEVDRDTLYGFTGMLCEVYGSEWWDELPNTSNPDYEYLCKIITTAQAALRGLVSG